MRRLLGGLVLVAGVGGLGWYGSGNTAQAMQAAVNARALEVASTSTFPIETSVSGRDITASGQVMDQVEFETLEAALNDIEGRRVVDMSGVAILPVADPFAMTATRAIDGTTTVEGAIGSDAGRDLIAAQVGDLAGGLVLSSGRPDDNWADVAARGLAGLAVLNSGEVTLSGQDMAITGEAMTPVERDAALAAIGNLPEGYGLSDEITVLDDGTPMRLNMSLRDTAMEATGKFPVGFAATEISDRFAIGEVFIIQEARVAGDIPNWSDAALTGMIALSNLIDAQLNIDGAVVRLAGVGSPDGKAQAEALLAGLPAPFTVTTSIGIYGINDPYRLSMTYTGSTVSVSGNYPPEYEPQSPNAAPFTDYGGNSYRIDDTAFTTNADAGIAALGLLESGELIVTADTIQLRGLAATIEIEAGVTEALQAAPADTTVTQTLSFIDDGSPAAWSVEYSAAGGGDLAGKLPINLAADDVSEALGLTRIDGDPFIALTGQDAPDDVLSALKIAGEYLPETENLTFTTSPDGTALDLVLSPGVNIDLVAADLAQRLPNDVQFSAAPLDVLPDVGTIRTNQATLLRERFQFGNWLPILTFAPVEPICRDRSAMALEGAGVNFITGSAQLDAKSIRAINALSAIANRCIDEGGLALEVGGHTDNVGAIQNNVVLSQERAAAVRAALIERGVNGEAITVLGYGPSQPVASNDTPEGRAANRRTEFTWSQQ